MAQLAFAGAGALAGGGLFGSATFLGLGGAQWGWMVGSIVGGLAQGADDTESHGPQLQGSTYTGNVEGTDIPVLWGGDRVTGKPIFLKPPRKVTTKEESGGKGGPTHTQYTYTYYQDFAICFTEFLLPGYSCPPPRRIWINHELVYDASGNNTEVNGNLSFVWYDGTTDDIDSIIEDYVGVGNCPSYKNRAVLMIDTFNLTSRSGNRLPIVEAEIQVTGSESSQYTEYNVGPTTNGYSDHNFVLRHPSTYEFAAFPKTSTQTPCAFHYVNMASQYAVKMREGTGSSAFQSACWWTDPLNYVRGQPSHFLTNNYLASGSNTIYKFEWPSGKLITSSAVNMGSGGGLLTHEVNNYLLVVNRDAGAGIAFINKDTLTQANSYNLDTLLSDTGWNTANLAPIRAGTWTGDSTGKYVWYVVADKSSGGKKFLEIEYDSVTPGCTATIVKTDVFSHLPNIGSNTIASENSTGNHHFYDEVNDEYWFPWTCSSGTDYEYGIMAIDPSNGNEIYFSDFVNDGYSTATSYWGTASGYPHLHFDFQERKLWWILSGTSLVGSIQIDSKTQRWYSGTAGTGNAWAVPYPNRNSVWGARINVSDYIFRELRLGYVSQGTVAISTVVSDICQICGLETSEFDVTTLTGKIIGSFMHTSRSSGRKDVETLLGYALADGVQSDYKLKFPLRGGSVTETISADDVAAQEVERDIQPKDSVNVTIPTGVEVPQTFEVQYRSSDNLYNQGISRSYTATGYSVDKKTSQLPMALTNQQASDVAEQYHQQMFDPRIFEFDLPLKYIFLEPTDVIEIPKNGKNHRIRITQNVRGQNWISKCKGIIDRSESYVSTAVAPGVDDFLGTINPLLEPEEIILDGPLMRDADLDHPGPYLTSFVYGDTYPNVVWFYSFDDAVYSQLIAQQSQPLVGKVATALSDSDWESWDDLNSFQVELIDSSQSLSSSTKANIEADPTINAYAYGRPGRWEYLNVATWTLDQSTPTKKYTATGLLRGRRGTDNFVPLHQNLDYLVELGTTGIFRQTLQNSQIGNTIFYKAPREDQQVSDVTSVNYEIDGQQLMPYSPIQIEGTGHTTTDWAASTAYSLNDEVISTNDDDRRYVCTTAGTSGGTEPTWTTTIGGTTTDNTVTWTAYHINDFDVSWTRRTRRGGSLGGDNTLTDGVGGPLQEDSKEYEIDFRNAFNENLVKTVTGITTEAYEYLGATQDTDGADTIGRFYLDVYQMSAVVGRGFRGRATYSRGWPEVLTAYLNLQANVIFELNDSSGSSAKEYVSDTTPGTYTSATTERALTSDTRKASSLKLDGSGYMKTGTTLSSVLSGKTKATICYFLFSSSTTNAERFIEMTQGGSGERWRIENSSGAIRQYIKPLNGNYTNQTSPSVDSEQFYGVTLFMATTVDIQPTEITFRHFVNGVYKNQTTTGSGALAYASTFQTQTRDANYNDTIGATIAASPTNISTSGGIGMIALWDSILADSDIADIWTAHKASIEDLYFNDENCVALTKFEQETAPASDVAWTAEIGSASGFGWKNRSFSSGKDRSIRIGCNYSAEATHQTVAYCYRDLTTAEKVQTFSWELWIKPNNTPSGNEWFLSLGPRDWNGTTKRGFHIFNDATTNGLTVRIGDGNASFTDYSEGTTNITGTTTIYHIVVTVDATNGIKAYINGSENFNSSGTTHTINWTDNTSGNPSVGTAYLKQSNDNSTSQTSPNGTGMRGYYQGVAFWDKELSSTEVANLYNRGSGTVV